MISPPGAGALLAVCVVLSSGGRVKHFGVPSGACCRRSDRCDARCGRGGPGWRRRGWDHQTSQATAILDGVVSHLTVIDARHGFAGQRLDLVSAHSARGPAFVLVRLHDGRRRSIRRSVTDLAAAPAEAVAPKSFPRISVRTPLKLMHHLNSTLTSRNEEVIRDEQTPAWQAHLLCDNHELAAVDRGPRISAQNVDRCVSGGFQHMTEAMSSRALSTNVAPSPSRRTIWRIVRGRPICAFVNAPRLGITLCHGSNSTSSLPSRDRICATWRAGRFSASANVETSTTEPLGISPTYPRSARLMLA